MRNLIPDFRYSLRQLKRSPGLTVVAVLSLALGIGANTAIFSLLNSIMLRDLPVKNPNLLVLFGRGRAAGSTDDFAETEVYSYAFFDGMKKAEKDFSDMSAVLSLMFEKMHGSVGGSANLEPMNVQLVSGSYFSMLGVKPLLGQVFTLADDEPFGGHPIAVVSYSWWQRRFGRDPSILGKTVKLGDTAYSIIGITPPDFFGTTVGQSPDLWIPLSMEKQVSPGWNGLDDKSFASLYLLARLKPGVPGRQAEASVNVIARQLWRSYAGTTLTAEQQKALNQAHIELTAAARGLSRLRFQFSKPLLVLMVVVGLVLLIACANIANLLLARGTARQREIAVRLAMGARRGRLVRQMLTESLLIALFGGALGVLFASWASESLLAMVSAGSDALPLSVSPDLRVLAFTFLVSLAAALLFGMAPALRSTHFDLTPALKEGRGAAPVAGRSALSRALIVAQVALSLVLLIGAGLFLRTLVNLANTDTGFDKNHVLMFGIDWPSAGYKEDARLATIYEQVEEKVNAQPGVRAASISFFTFNQGEWSGDVSIQGRPASPESDMMVTFNVVGARYFSTMGIPLMVGRLLGPQDTATSPKVAVINETMAKRFFPGDSPIGHRFGSGEDPKHSGDIEIVGVVKDAKYESLRERPRAAAYFPYSQRIGYYFDLEVRYVGDPQTIISEVRRAVGEVDHALPVVYENSLAEQVDRSLASQTLIARLSAFFGLLAVFLASIGIYGLMSYAVSRRTNEIGLRMALGAARANVLWLVMKEALILVAAGLAIGLPVAFGADRLVSSLLYGLSAADPATIAGAAAFLLAFAALAGYLPSRRASKVDPMVALRYE